MIKLENTEVVGWEAAIRGMRNPMNSWEKSDSYETDNNCIVGENDHDLMMRLAKAGSVHAKYRRMIVVYVDIVAPMYFWSEFDTYKVGTVANSCSKMHKMMVKPFEMNDFSFDKLPGYKNEVGLQPRGLSTYTGKFTEAQREEIKQLWNSGEYSKREIAKMYGVSHTCINDIISNKYMYATKVNVFETVARPIVDTLNELRDFWLREQDETKKKQIWYSILQLLPVSYNQRRTVKLNYEVLAGIYRDRKNHKLDEWRNLCKWIEGLPYSEIITCENETKLLKESIIDILRTHRYTDEECVEKISELVGIRINKEE